MKRLTWAGVIGVATMIAATVSALLHGHSVETMGATALGLAVWSYAAVTYWRDRALRVEPLAKATIRAQGAIITAGGGWAVNESRDIESLKELRLAMDVYRASRPR